MKYSFIFNCWPCIRWLKLIELEYRHKIYENVHWTVLSVDNVVSWQRSLVSIHRLGMNKSPNNKIITYSLSDQMPFFMYICLNIYSIITKIYAYLITFTLHCITVWQKGWPKMSHNIETDLSRRTNIPEVTYSCKRRYKCNEILYNLLNKEPVEKMRSIRKNGWLKQKLNSFLNSISFSFKSCYTLSSSCILF